MIHIIDIAIAIAIATQQHSVYSFQFPYKPSTAFQPSLIWFAMIWEVQENPHFMYTTNIIKENRVYSGYEVAKLW